MNNKPLLALAMIAVAFLSGCAGPDSDESIALAQQSPATPEYFLLRPEVEKAYGYTHAIKIGGDICTSSEHVGPLEPFSKRHFSARTFSSLAC